MTPVDLYYNPYFQTASLYTSGTLRNSGRLGGFISGKPMDKWLEAYSEGYIRWQGFLIELITDLNDDELAIKFIGLPEDYETFHEAVISQNLRVRQMGYSPSAWSVKNVPAFLPEGTSQMLMNLTASLITSAPSQESLMYMDMVLDGGEAHTVSGVMEMYSRLSCALDKAESYCLERSARQAHRWGKARTDLDVLMKKGVIEHAELADR